MNSENPNEASVAKTTIDDLVVLANDTGSTEISDLSIALPTTPQKLIDIDELAQTWTLEEQRDHRTKVQENKSKIQSIRGGQVALVGGDFVSFGEERVSTLAFCFEGCPTDSRFASKKYGLTTAHGCLGVGEEVYAFASNIPNSHNQYPMKKIGVVVAVSFGIDSLLFELEPDIKVELNTIRTSHDTKFTLDLSSYAAPPCDADCGTRLCGFGAQRRGTVGEFSKIWSGRRDDYKLLKHDIGIMSLIPHPDDGNDERQNRKAITHETVV